LFGDDSPDPWCEDKAQTPARLARAETITHIWRQVSHDRSDNAQTLYAQIRLRRTVNAAAERDEQEEGK
jgi:hypothetical protein